MTLANRESVYGPILVAAFTNVGLPPEWGMAIARQESAFKPAVINNTGGDALRGGSRGLCQMSLKTARALGFVGDPDLLFQPVLNAQLAAKLCLSLTRQFKTAELKDIAAGYNSGKPFARCPASTVAYANNVVAYAAAYKERARALASGLLHQSAVAALAPVGVPVAAIV